jgi:hypothetical protein
MQKTITISLKWDDASYYNVVMFKSITPVANVMKLFLTVIY